MTKHIFSPEETQNECLGKKGKEPLDPSKLGKVKGLVMHYYDVNAQKQEQVWKDCIKRFNEFLHRKKNQILIDNL